MNGVGVTAPWRRWLDRGVGDLAMIVIGALWLLPFLWMVSTAFKAPEEIYRVPPVWVPTEPTVAHFTSVWAAAPFARYYLNSGLIALLTTVLTLLIASMAGYALARLPFRGRSVLLSGILSSTMIPFQVLLIPFFILMTTLRLVNTPGGLVLGYLVLFMPFAVFMFRAYFLELPREIEESARIDGCSWLGVWWRIALPTARPALATIGIYTFIESWNEFFLALVLTNSQTMRTLPVGLAMLRNDVVGISWGEIMASSLMAGAPAILVFIILQRQLIAGLTGGAVKG
jgi:ABC-type glycerol-3-phosphate transport system permease component